MTYFSDECWIQRTAYWSNIFGQLNKLHLKLHGKNLHIIHFRDNLQTFVSKLENWRRRTNLENYAVFEHLCTEIEASQAGIVENLKEEIDDHLQSLESEIQRYFPELSEQEAAVVRNPFHVSLRCWRPWWSARLIYRAVEWFHSSWSTPRNTFNVILLCHAALLSLRLVPFASTYLSKSRFSTLAN